MSKSRKLHSRSLVHNFQKSHLFQNLLPLADVGSNGSLERGLVTNEIFFPF